MRTISLLPMDGLTRIDRVSRFGLEMGTGRRLDRGLIQGDLNILESPIRLLINNRPRMDGVCTPHTFRENDAFVVFEDPCSDGVMLIYRLKTMPQPAVDRMMRELGCRVFLRRGVIDFAERLLQFSGPGEPSLCRSILRRIGKDREKVMRYFSGFRSEVGENQDFGPVEKCVT